MATYKLCAYWKARKETVQACADRLAQFLAALSGCDAVFATWYKRGMSRRKAKQVETDFKNRDCLLDLLEQGRNRKDIGKEVIEELGFHIGIWNGGKSTKMVGLDVTCGLYATTAGLGGNSVVINLPEELGDLRSSERMANVLVAVAMSWEPDWAGVFSLEAMSTRNFNPAVPFVDWMLYVSHKLVPKSDVLEPSLVKPVDDIGTIVVVEQDSMKVDNLAHLEKVRMIETAIGIKG